MMLAELGAAAVRSLVVVDDFHPDLARALRAEILSRASRAAGSAPSLNIGGWKSGEGFFGWAHPAVEALHAALRDAFGAKPIVGWAMVNRSGSHHPRHRHDGSLVSGVYYVDPGEDPPASTIFEIPGRGDVAVVPDVGRLVLFPGSIWHRVPTCDGDAPRVTVAFDVRR